MTPAEHTAVDKTPDRIAGMFDAIAPRYDLLNHVLSGGLDLYWRQRAVRALALTGRETVLDLCTGTADLALAIVKRRGAALVVGIDFSDAMLRIGRGKVRAAGHDRAIRLVRGDAMRIPAASGSADAVTITFGLRNVEDPSAAIGEMARVLAPAGRLAILEFATPETPVLRQAYLWYFHNVLPRIGRLVSRHPDAYSYLPASVSGFASPSSIRAMLVERGFDEVRAIPLACGTVQLYVARRASDGA